MNGKLPLVIWLAVVIAMFGLAPIDAVKANRGTNHKTKAHAPNHDHVRLTHAAPSHSQPHHHAQSHSYPHQQQHVQQSHVPQTHPSAPALPPQSHPGAPALPSTNGNSDPSKHIGWNVRQSDTVPKPQTVSNTNAGFQQPHAAAAPPPPYSPYAPNNNAGVPPPPYSPYVPNNNAGLPPPYPANPNLVPQNAGFQPSYPGQNIAGHNAQSYPGVYQQQQHPQVPYNPNAAGSYPMQQQPGYVPSGQQPVVNNYYQEHPKSGGTGSALQTAAIAGIGGLALYGALKPSEEKTIIIHEGGSTAAVPASPPNAAQVPIPAAAPATVPAVAPSVAPAPVSAVDPGAVLAAPAVPVVQPSAIPSVPQQNPSGVFVTPVPSSESVPSVPLAPLPQQHQQSVPLAPLPDQSTATPLAPLPDQSTVIPLAPLPDQSTVVPVTPQNVTVVEETTTTRLAQPNAAPTVTNNINGEAAHAPLKGAAPNFIIFNMSFYTCISIALAKLM